MPSAHPYGSGGRPTHRNSALRYSRSTQRNREREYGKLAHSVRFHVRGRWDSEVHAAFVILLLGSGKVKLGESDLLCPPITQFIERFSDNCVVHDLGLMAVLIYQHRGGLLCR